ncbi:OmpA family protein [Parasedimentitalea maritima]|uniref:OmpA family protein n=1 Tax=Parasedimentitalea maritima TaxID=2578117 RepID=A0A5R8YY13_9RHOB|nr:OmpA family protein [Zongyanglinia marina]KAE9627331.1 OmpA family protein [Zongyanglinia marina]TLP58379.1 OmpA family protein [Zongyanglinia marina]
MIKHAAFLGLSLTVAACSIEAGHELDRGTFGNATLNNSQVMSGEQNYAIQLAKRFAEEVPSTINFEFDSARLDANARAVLDQQAAWIKQFPEVRFRVFGHTDAVGSAHYNKSLGLRRARAAVSYLSTRGISRSRLEAVVSYGETQPLIATQGRERQNRRTLTEVSGFLKRHPSLLDGKYAQVVYREYIASAVPATTMTTEQSLPASSQ